MRRLLALSVAAAAITLAAPAPAQAVPCYGTAYVGVCTGVECTRGCNVVVDPYCDIPGPVILACEWVDDL